jgi:hypothetical protein
MVRVANSSYVVDSRPDAAMTYFNCIVYPIVAQPLLAMSDNVPRTDV